ncbi:hypothetical protein IMG5_158060 [Ichthyophthirius multifiliis]|uniref:Phosphodiesterase n=1 Tax=Ichthyophthirius multifiliis TaxID=5932 RepID=G0QZL8_ICHMU|nr:hypothetical protein IMG5_158060 [Ichthyophthirius multifiliis]EGR29338.1 hypothetical protein IMG5_158060 [Ichthyophthirius multifiliis]|eukprot:XP_004030574.1 hypothetical protein IMG5_158060 [Ichthyophthirius multifiliis]
MSRSFDNWIIILVIIFTIIVFVYFAIDTRDNKYNKEIQSVIKVFQYIELVILFIFQIEIFLKMYTFSIQVYFKDKWLLVDMIIMVASIVILVLDIVLNDSQFTTISKILRGIFRFMRLFLVFRKVSQFKVIQITSSNSSVKTSMERILEIMNNIKKNVDDIILIKQIDWCIKQIENNKIYDPIFEDTEAAKWVNIYANTEQNSKKKKQQTVLDKQLKNQLNSNAQKAEDQKTQLVNLQYQSMKVPEEFLKYFETIDNIDFQVFKYYQELKKNNLAYLLIYLFNRYDINNTAKIDPNHLWNWSNHISAGYKNNPYHNNVHAFDVTQTVHFFIQSCEFIQVAELNSLEIGIMYIAAAGHDYEHPGFNNPFLVNSKGELAISYNDKSPLENHHSFSVFYLMTKDNSNLFTNFSKEDKKKSRERIINMILHTDNAVHFSDLAMLKGRQQAQDFNPKNKDKDICMNALLHAADISNPYKPWDICKVWTQKVMQEFWNQGDEEKERNLPVSYLCDRYTTNTAKCQIGFIDFVVFPLYDTINKFIPKLDLGNFALNKKKWTELIDFYEEDLKMKIEQLEKAEKNLQNSKAQQ